MLVIAVVLLQSCFSDDFDKVMTYETLPLLPAALSDGSPVPGEGGIINHLYVPGGENLRISWAKAADDRTPQANLEYRAYYSTSNNISTPAMAEANGTWNPPMTWTADIGGAILEGLTAGTTYYFNVVVRDGDGNMAAYLTTSVTTSSDAVYMFPAGSYNGNLLAAVAAKTTKVAVTARESADALCSSAMLSSYPTLPCLNVRAFISVDSGDDIAGMWDNFSIPIDRKIVGPTGIQIGGNWADLLDDEIDVSLSEAGIATDHWWSGSLSNGTFDSSNNCGEWTSTSEKGRTGLHDQPDDRWIQSSSNPNCDASRIVLCVCW